MSALPDRDATRTRIAELSPRAVRLVVAVTLLATLMLCLLTLQEGVPPQAGATKVGDATAYAMVVDRLRSGESYYPAMHHVLVAEGYGTGSVFNWRTPLYLCLVAALPSIAGMQALLGLIALTAIVVLYTGRRSGGVLVPVLTAVLLSLNFASLASPTATLFAEIAAGCLMVASVAAYDAGRRWAGIILGLLALFVRELTGLYVVVCLLLAVRHRHWREVAAWSVGLAGYLVYLAWHRVSVLAQRSPDDPSYAEGWVQLGGVTFALSTAQFNGLLMLAPRWVTALLLPLAMLGLAATRGGERSLLTVCGYLALFSVVGKPENVYWGAVFTPLLMIGLAWSVPALLEAWRHHVRSP